LGRIYQQAKIDAYSNFGFAKVYADKMAVRVIDFLRTKELAKEGDEIVHLTVLNGTEVIYIDKIESTRSFQIYSRLRRHASAYCTGVGKVLSG